jgi:hypothetical protein
MGEQTKWGQFWGEDYPDQPQRTLRTLAQVLCVLGWVSLIAAFFAVVALFKAYDSRSSLSGLMIWEWVRLGVLLDGALAAWVAMALLRAAAKALHLMEDSIEYDELDEEEEHA